MRVRIQVFDDRMCQHHEAMIEISEHLVRDGLRAVDYPSPNADATTAAIFCTPLNERYQIKMVRDQLACAITTELMRFFEREDTQMGYPIPK